MEIREENGSWHGYANLGTVAEKDHYNIFANSLDELRELAKEGADGDLEMEGLEFEEVFLTTSDSTE
jgi:hypothetical protein